MATTIPALTSVDDILDTDLVMVTHSNGQTFKINGAELNKRNQAVISENTTLTGAPLKTRNIIRAYFTADLVAANSSTPLTLSYNGVSYTVKVPKNGALANYLPFDVGGGVYKYLQAYTTLELLFDGTNLVVQGNPVVLSSADYTIYPDGSVTYKANVTPLKSSTAWSRRYNLGVNQETDWMSTPSTSPFLILIQNWNERAIYMGSEWGNEWRYSLVFGNNNLVSFIYSNYSFKIVNLHSDMVSIEIIRGNYE